MSNTPKALDAARRQIEMLTDRIERASNVEVRANVLYERAEQYDEVGEYVKAAKDKFAALEIARDKKLITAIKMSMVFSLLRSEQREESLCWAADAVNGAPDHPVARYLMGFTLARLGFFHLAIESLRKAIELDPDYAAAKEKLSECLREVT